uniref:Uncharacterized protein n=1 Tax=Anguilla anguilla TaxID=7936 RepID=A0A0E9QKY5_ANGAN
MLTQARRSQLVSIFTPAIFTFLNL